MLIEIITPEKQLFSGEVKQVKLPGMNGGFELLEDHAPIISSLRIGDIIVTDMENKKHEFEIGGGVVECSDNKVIVLAE